MRVVSRVSVKGLNIERERGSERGRQRQRQSSVLCLCLSHLRRATVMCVCAYVKSEADMSKVFA